jgi:TPR repeat protein
MRALILMLVVCLVSSSLASAEDAPLTAAALLAKGEEAYDDGSYAQALQWYAKAAEQGNPRAEFRLGALYESGRGVRQDFALAAAWYRKAAERGDIEAELSLAALYSNGFGVPQDYAQALAWERKAADQGDALAALMVGDAYRNGAGVPVDMEQARSWYRKSIADHGNIQGANAQFQLCDISRNDWLQAAAANDPAGMDRVIATIDHSCTLMLNQAKAWRDHARSGAKMAFEPEAWIDARGAAIDCGTRGLDGKPIVPDEDAAKRMFLAAETAIWPKRNPTRFPAILIFDHGDQWVAFRTKRFTPPRGRGFYHYLVGPGDGQLELAIDKCDGAMSESSEGGLMHGVMR